MKLFKYFIIFLTLLACNTGKDKSQNSANCDSLSFACLQDKIKEGESALNQQKCDINSIRTVANSNIKPGITAIPILKNIVKHCYSQLKQADKDSVFVLFTKVYDLAISELNDSLYSQYRGLVEKWEKNLDDNQTKDFMKCLDACGLDLFTSEGSFYIDQKPDYLYNLFKDNSSPALENYLKIRSDELKAGYSEDAGLLIGWDDLYKRVVIWEDYLSKYPDFFMKDQADFFYSSYLSTLLSGMDNTPVFEFENQIILPEVKNLYEKIIAKKTGRNSTKIIFDYYNLLKNNNFKQPENIQDFLDKSGLTSKMEF